MRYAERLPTTWKHAHFTDKAAAGIVSIASLALAAVVLAPSPSDGNNVYGLTQPGGPPAAAKVITAGSPAAPLVLPDVAVRRARDDFPAPVAGDTVRLKLKVRNTTDAPETFDTSRLRLQIGGTRIAPEAAPAIGSIAPGAVAVQTVSFTPTAASRRAVEMGATGTALRVLAATPGSAVGVLPVDLLN